MKAIERDLQYIVKNLKLLTEKTEKIARELEKLEKPQAVTRKKSSKTTKTPAKSTKKAVAKKQPVQATAIETVLKIIAKRKRGVDTETLKKLTGFNRKKVWNTTNRLKKAGKIKNSGRGLYVKA